MMKNLTQVLIIVMLLPAFSIPTAMAKSENLQLSVSRTWGYSGFHNDIQGHFTLSVRGPDDLQSVQFLMDGEIVLEKSEPPFQFKLNTDDYQNGVHTLSAVGILRDDARISSTEFTREYVSAPNYRMQQSVWEGKGLYKSEPVFPTRFTAWLAFINGTAHLVLHGRK